ncbi:MAG: hypothetical protein ACRDDD_01825 [Plesiomonas sp.]|uniref:hypothetical protein n=1 Tax=Plesiomonas sp. TaxID=2486279 RepID=UPI003EE80C17
MTGHRDLPRNTASNSTNLKDVKARKKGKGKGKGKGKISAQQLTTKPTHRAESQ